MDLSKKVIGMVLTCAVVSGAVYAMDKDENTVMIQKWQTVGNDNSSIDFPKPGSSDTIFQKISKLFKTA